MLDSLSCSFTSITNSNMNLDLQYVRNYLPLPVLVEHVDTGQ